MIKNIILDIGNVLVHFRWQELMEELGFFQEEIKHLGTCMIASKVWSEWDRGVIGEKEVVSVFKTQNPDISEKIEQFFAHKGELVEQFKYAEQWIKAFKQRGYKVYLLSNYPEEIFRLHAEEVFTFLPLTDGRVVSADVKMVKPDPAIYEYLIQKYALNKEECVFIDDSMKNVEAAANLGIRSILFKSYEQVSEELEKILNA